MPNSLNNALNNIDLSSLGMSMNGAPSGGLRLNFNINTLINPNPSVPVGAMTASQHAVKTGVDEKGNDIINAATPGQITSQYNILLANKNAKSAIGGFINSKVGKFGSSYGGVIGDTASAIGNMIGKRGLDGKHGGITKGMDTAYDTIQKAAANLGPYGQIVSAAMGVNKLIGNAVSKIGGGTDGMTKTDAVLNSAFLNMTPLGLINGFGGKKANTYTRNTELDKSTNGGFLGFLTTQDVTQIGAGKKYGLFSSGARNKQNQLTEFTSNMKHTISGIVDTNTINNLAAQGSTPFIANQQSVDLSGGVQQMRAARHGMLFSRRVISKYAIGNKISNDDPRVKAMLARFGNNLEKLKLNIADGTIKPIAKDDSRALDINKRFGYRREYTDLATAPIGTIMQRYNINKPAANPTSYSEELKFPEVNKLESNTTPQLQNNSLDIISEFNPNEMYASNFMNTLPNTAASMNIEQPTWDKNGVTQLQSILQTTSLLPISQSFNYTIPGILSVINGWNLFGRKKKGFVGDVVGKYQQGNKLKRTFKTVDVATGKYVEIPKDLDKDQIKGRTPIRLYNGTVVFMNGDGTVTSDRWEVIGQREHLTPKGLNGTVIEQKIPSLTDFMEQKILERTEAAIQKAISRKTPYMFKNPNWKNCIATATDNFGIPIVMRNVDLAEDPNKYGFEELQFGDNTDSLPDGVLILDYNNPKNRNIPGHTIMLVGRTESGAPIYSYSSGDNNANSMHNLTRNYSFYWTDAVKPRAYRYIGTPTERESWEKEYYTLYPQLVPSLKQGGKVNVIPEGALHARLNHLDLVNDDLTHVTTKGIPVITKEGGEVIQHAEIEHSEIIFTLDVTNKIEDLRKKWHEGKEDEYAIEAGKLLVKEILHNTDDRTNLIESIE